ncbi:MAG: dipeptidase [Candidatus Krumholzibacteriia bacterium]
MARFDFFRSRRRPALIACALSALLAGVAPAAACTNFLVTKGASADGSTFITYSADSHSLYGELYLRQAGVHQPGEKIPVHEWDTGKYLGEIDQAPVTYGGVGNMNEHQVSVGETTFGGREGLRDSTGVVDYGSLMYLALARAKTAREAIGVMTDLVAKYGYCSEGESFSVADPNEAWILEMVGKGPGGRGAVWVAVRVPDGYVSGHANQSRIRRFPLKDPENCLYAPDVIAFARAQGWFAGADADFSFADTYNPLEFGALRACEARVWCGFTRIAPSLNLSPDYVMGDLTAPQLPLWVKPDHKLTVHDVMQMMRDHFEGTPMDLSQGVGAGPYRLPYRWRPMDWKIDGQDYIHERAVSTQQTGFSFVAQMRRDLPDPVGGVFWFGLDDTYCTVYTPMYCAIRAVPHSFAVGTGDWLHFTWDSAFYVFNFVANWTYSRWSDMIVDVQLAQRELEGGFLARQPEVEKEAARLAAVSPEQAVDYLTRYSCEQGELVTARWRKLGEFLVWKYMDGNVKDEYGVAQHPRYPDDWYRRIVAEDSVKLRVRPLPAPPTRP